MNRVSCIVFVLLSACLTAQDSSKSPDDRVRDLERQLGESQPNEQQRERQEKERQRDFEEIKALGLPDRGLREFRSRNPEANVLKWSVGYFRTKEVVMMSILFSDAEAKRAQQELGFKRRGEKWEIFWMQPAVLEKRANQPPEPTAMSVTPRAYARVAPAIAVAHL